MPIPLRKMRALFLLILLSGCCSQRGWLYHDVFSDCSQFDSAQIMHVPDNNFNGIEVQFLKGEFGVIGFLGVYSRCISSSVVIVAIGEERYRYEGICMQGGQRLQLPEEATQQIISALLEENEVTIYLEGYFTKLCPANFCSQYRKF